MKINLTSLLAGFIFSLGLGIAGMTQPAKVIGFLDIFGDWDPSLLFVMVGAISVHFILYRVIIKRPSPFLSKQWSIPDRKEITPALVIGAVLFGVGWGMSGYCPGPAVVSLANLKITPIVFVASMIVGMFVFQIVDKKFKFKK